MKNPILNIAISAARAAGNLITRGMGRLDTLQIHEKTPNDYVTEIDQKAEQEIIKIIRKAYPNHRILAEESGELRFSNKPDDYLWIIDPLDGTRNFIHGFPQFAVSIAVKHKNKIEHGVIYDPIRQELFTASRGRGAQLNDRRLRVSKKTALSGCLLGTGFHRPDSAKQLQFYLKTLETILPLAGDIRRAGSAALDLAYVAAGRLDGFWEADLKAWDIAAGALLIKEAGGLVCDWEGGEDYLAQGHVIAGNPKILKILLKTLLGLKKNL